MTKLVQVAIILCIHRKEDLQLGRRWAPVSGLDIVMLDPNVPNFISIVLAIKRVSNVSTKQ